jgi:hypothetical protein
MSAVPPPPPAEPLAHQYTGRIAAILAVVAALAAGLAPVVANMDLSSTAGLIAAIVAVAGVVIKFIDGSQKYEARERLLQAGALTPATAKQAGAGTLTTAALAEAQAAAGPAMPAPEPPPAPIPPQPQQSAPEPEAEPEPAIDPDAGPDPDEEPEPLEPGFDEEADVPDLPTDAEIDAVDTMDLDSIPHEGGGEALPPPEDGTEAVAEDEPVPVEGVGSVGLLGGNGATGEVPSSAGGNGEVDEVALYGEANLVTGLTEADVEEAIGGPALDDEGVLAVAKKGSKKG